MNKKSLSESIVEAKRFLKRAESLMYLAAANNDVWYGCPATGGVKRSSMDLTRSLAKLRKGE